MKTHLNEVAVDGRMRSARRRDTATSAAIDFAITLSTLAGKKEAMFYLEKRRMAPELIDRIFHGSGSDRRSCPDRR